MPDHTPTPRPDPDQPGPATTPPRTGRAEPSDRPTVDRLTVEWVRAADLMPRLTADLAARSANFHARAVDRGHQALTDAAEYLAEDSPQMPIDRDAGITR